MILTCPDCATSYFVEDSRIPPRGRTVRCSSCGARWRATPEGVVAEDDDDGRAVADVLAVAPIEAPPAAPPEDDLEFVAAPVAPVRKPAPRKRPIGLMIAAGVGAAVIALAGAAAVLRGPIVEMVPAAAPVFAAVGLPTHALGLVIEGVAWKMDFVGGRPVISITGQIRSVNKAAVTAPPVRVDVLDRKKHVLVTYDLMLTNARVPPGGRRYFAWNLPDPPSETASVKLEFNPEAAATAAIADTAPSSPEAPTKHE